MMIAAAGPKLQPWRLNPEGETRTAEEARVIASQWGVSIPDYVTFTPAPTKRFAENEYAKTTDFREFDGTIIRWRWLFTTKGKIPFLVREDVFQSDEAIVAVFGHEVFELELLRQELDDDSPIEVWEAQTMPENPNNFHWQAWDYADALVERMRKGG